MRLVVQKRGGRGMDELEQRLLNAPGLSRLNYMDRGKLETRLNLQGPGLFGYPAC